MVGAIAASVVSSLMISCPKFPRLQHFSRRSYTKLRIQTTDTGGVWGLQHLRIDVFLHVPQPHMEGRINEVFHHRKILTRWHQGHSNTCFSDLTRVAHHSSDSKSRSSPCVGTDSDNNFLPENQGKVCGHFTSCGVSSGEMVRLVQYIHWLEGLKGFVTHTPIITTRNRSTKALSH